MAGIDDRNPYDDYQKILFELKQYDPELVAKPHLVAANKMDEESAEANLKKFHKRFPKVEVMEIMAEIDEGIPELKRDSRQQKCKSTFPSRSFTYPPLPMLRVGIVAECR